MRNNGILLAGLALISIVLIAIAWRAVPQSLWGGQVVSKSSVMVSSTAKSASTSSSVTTAIPKPKCGNGKVEPPEECDDGGACLNDDGTRDYCEEDSDCPGGVPCFPESGDGCNNKCLKEICGNRRVDAGEECDDGNMVPNDGCTDCRLDSLCGNGKLDPGEDCDDGKQCYSGGPRCTEDRNCLVGPCETHDFDGCSSSCKKENTVCGDGKVEGIEECDDGNTANDDGCSSTCKKELCGDGIKQANEECDDGMHCHDRFTGGQISCLPPDPDCLDTCEPKDEDGCNSACKLEYCGDGIRQDDEECDDGMHCIDDNGHIVPCTVDTDGVCNQPGTCDPMSGDGCSAECMLER